MGMNGEELVRVIGDLQRLVGIPVAGVWQPARDRVVLGIGDDNLLLVPRGPHARVHTIAGRPRNPARPFSFQGACRAHLVGPCTALRVADGERIVDLVFGGKRLHLRLTGRSGGLWLLDGDVVLAAYDGPAPAALPELPARDPRVDVPRFAPEGDEDWDRAARRFFDAEERRAAVADRRAEIERAIRRHIARSERLAERLERDLDNASRAPRLRRMADALAAVLHTVPRGATSFRVEDLEEPGTWHEVPLDPERPAAVALDRLYAKARRLDRAGDRVLEHLDDVQRRIRALHEALERVATADTATLDELARLAPPTVARAPARARAPEPWDTWVGPAGERVLVGRNERGNRRLTFQIARGDDWWMHVRGRPGAHLILSVPKDRSPPLELLLAAAQIALIHAKVPDGVAADVQYTRVRNVRALPGEIGRVLVHDEKVLRVTRDAAALRGWTREDDD